LKPRLALRCGDGLSEEACRRLTLVATVLGSSMAYVTAITVAVPAIGADLDIDLGGQQWVMISYSLALASLYLVAGVESLDSRRDADYVAPLWMERGRVQGAASPLWSSRAVGTIARSAFDGGCGHLCDVDEQRIVEIGERALRLGRDCQDADRLSIEGSQGNSDDSRRAMRCLDVSDVGRLGAHVNGG
jgi:hypothetical protein